MQRLRHPVRAIREPFGKAGLTVAILALVLATTGAAFAAAGLNSKQKKEVTKIAKKFAGKPGTNGTNGTNGSPGAKGDTGAAGSNGTNGTNGKSVTVTTVNSPGCNGQAGAEVKQEGAASGVKVCNGTTGFTKTLPSEETEKGTWAIVGGLWFEEGFPLGRGASPISFNIPLASAPAAHVIQPGQVGTGTDGCPAGSSVTNPEAEPGSLCVFLSGTHVGVRRFEGNLTVFAEGANGVVPERTGAVVALFGEFKEGSESEGVEAVNATGTWAVTAE